MRGSRRRRAVAGLLAGLRGDELLEEGLGLEDDQDDAQDDDGDGEAREDRADSDDGPALVLGHLGRDQKAGERGEHEHRGSDDREDVVDLAREGPRGRIERER